MILTMTNFNVKTNKNIQLVCKRACINHVKNSKPYSRRGNVAEVSKSLLYGGGRFSLRQAWGKSAGTGTGSWRVRANDGNSLSSAKTI